jgi:hypothetical protein
MELEEVFLEKAHGICAVKRMLAYCGTQKFIIVFKWGCWWESQREGGH